MSVNSDLMDDAIRRQIDVLRLRAGVTKRLLKLITELDDDLTESIAGKLANLSKKDQARLARKANFSTSRLKALRESLRQIQRVSEKALEKGVKEELTDLAKVEADFWTKKVGSYTSRIGLNTTTVSAQTLSTAISTNPIEGELLKDAVKTWSNRKVSEIERAIRKGFANSQSVDQIVRNVKQKIDVSRNHARTIVRTSVNQMSQVGRSAFAEANNDLVKDQIWVSTLDSRTTPICIDRDGKLVNKGLGGATPPAHYNCRSTTTFVLKSWRELGVDIDEFPGATRSSFNGYVPQKTTYPEFFERQEESFKKKVLGKSRYELYASGEYEITDFIDRSGDWIGVKQLAERGL